MKLYHGDDYGTLELDPNLMYHPKSMNFLAIGICFTTDLDYAKTYGSKISYIDTNDIRNIKNCEDFTADYDYGIVNIDAEQIKMILRQLGKNSVMRIADELDISLDDRMGRLISELLSCSLGELQLILARSIPPTEGSKMVSAWNRWTNIGALRSKYENNTYVVIQTDIKVNALNF